jgi:hypothetical protein
MEVFAGCVSEDKDKDNNNNDNKGENDNKDTDNEDKDDSNKDNKNEYNENRSINDNDKDNIMPPKLKQASMLPTKATKKESGVEKLTSAISKTLKITTPPFKPYSMKTLDGYMVITWMTCVSLHTITLCNKSGRGGRRARGCILQLKRMP